MTHSNEIEILKPQKQFLTESSLSLNTPDPSNPKDELLKSDMLKKLSLKEKWLNEQAAAAALTSVAPMDVDEKTSSPSVKKKDDKKSFFNGILSSVKHLIKPDKEKLKSPSPPSGDSFDLDKIIADENIDVDNFDELVVESDKPVPGCVNRRIQAFLQKQKSEEIREEADGVLSGIKDGNDRLAKQMRDMEQKRFSDNMNAIKSSVVDSKVASMKEVNISKYFPSQQEKKPPAVAKNRDVKALKDVNLSKYFPQSSPIPGKKPTGSPNGQSATSSAAASPLMPRKNVNEIDLANYFPGTPVLSRKASVSTPPSSPLTETAPSFERRFSISSIPPPPPPPIAKKNVLALQSVKKRQPSNENVDTNVQVKKETTSSKAQNKTSKDFNMFDQLLDGAIDLKQIEEKCEDLDNFDALIDETRLERSPSKEYAEIFNADSGKSKSGSKEISPDNQLAVSKKTEIEEVVQEVKKVKKTKKKSPKKPDFLDKLSIDPKIFKNLTSEYQRLLVELERSSKSPETEESAEQAPEPQKVEIKPEETKEPPRFDNKRKSPQRFEDRKKFKEEFESVKAVDVVHVEAEEDSVVARLEKKYRRGSIKSIEETAAQEDHPVVLTTAPKIAQEVATVTQGTQKPIVAADDSRPIESLSVIERLERKLRLKREKENQQASLDEAEAFMIIKDSPKLNSVVLVKDQCKKQDELKPVEPLRKAEKAKKTKPELKPLSPQKSSPKHQEVNSFEKLWSLPKEGINDIFSEFETTERETEKALKEFNESFDALTNEEAAETENNYKVLEPIANLPKEKDFAYSLKREDEVINNNSVQRNIQQKVKRNSIEKQQADSTNKSEDIKSDNNRKHKRKSLQMDLAEIDFGISERPLNLDSFFPRRDSVEEIPDSPKSLTSSDDAKLMSAKDSAYSGSRKSSAEVKEIEEAMEQVESNPTVAASYIDVLKEISSGLIGFDDEPLMFMEPQVKAKAKNAQMSTEPTNSSANVKQSYTKVLQDISSTLVGLDLHDVLTKTKNYSQIIPPFVCDPIPVKRVASANNLEVPIDDKIHEFHPDANEVVDIKIPVPPVRRHRSAESSDAPELSLKSKRVLPSSKSFDYDTVSGRTSKNSTEYYDHYYPTTTTTTGRRLEKYEPTARRESVDSGTRTRNRQRAIDDLMVKSTKSRMYDADPTPVRRQIDHRRESSEPSDANVLLERSHLLHRRKENFMRDQMNESNNPYIREMMKQDVDNPIDISDIKFIRNHPTTSLPTTNYSSYQRPVSSYVPTAPTRTYGKSSALSSHTPITTSSYSRSSAINPVSSYKPSTTSSSYLRPSSNTAASILTKSHTLSPHSSHSTSYTPRQRPITSLSDQHTSTSSRVTSHSRPTSYSNKKSSGSSRDACVIS